MGSGGAEYAFQIINRIRSEVEKLQETNRRLNRRCQQAESELNTVRREMSSAIKIMEFEAKRAHRYANALRDVHKHHERLDRMPWIKCWCCRLRRWVRFQIWNRMFAMKETNRHIR